MIEQYHELHGSVLLPIVTLCHDWPMLISFPTRAGSDLGGGPWRGGLPEQRAQCAPVTSSKATSMSVSSSSMSQWRRQSQPHAHLVRLGLADPNSDPNPNQVLVLPRAQKVKSKDAP